MLRVIDLFLSFFSFFKVNPIPSERWEKLFSSFLGGRMARIAFPNPGRHSFLICPGLVYVTLSGQKINLNAIPKFPSFGGVRGGFPCAISTDQNRGSLPPTPALRAENRTVRCAYISSPALTSGHNHHLQSGDTNQFRSDKNSELSHRGYPASQTTDQPEPSPLLQKYTSHQSCKLTSPG